MASATGLLGSQSDKHGVRKGRAGKTHAAPEESREEQEKLPAPSRDGREGGQASQRPGWCFQAGGDRCRGTSRRASYFRV